MSAAQLPVIHSQLIAVELQIVTPHDLLLTASACILGRSSECDVVVREGRVSRRHAQIERRGDHYILSDLGSSNGTYVNGQRLLGQHLLRNEDRIGLGNPTALLRFVDPEATQISAGVLRFDERSQSFVLGGAPLDLPPLQLMLLVHLFQHAGEVCSRSSCAQAIWGRPYDARLDQGALDTALSDLRKALRQADPTVDPIETRRGLGYVLHL
ncbi:MAG: FHA domain-containing protein [Chloroflexales bacterium]|nr:FHA domain-containing protein [Chloroflexales bacterium]